ncbi:CAAX amino terminal protease family protein [Tannerella forsythia KS16]|jgi:CAAX amino terminal protease family.|uniref:CPBP family intramembrane glutamic endopeptidase n=2 Tax=Tannerella forsythia TaxID=28112 RepID=UPI000618D317|nr:type II CAAX endopeptidase family protein [Tannerella forsythia]BAR51896.1 CAAX amino terminal protease family protein [Tannerella forsythia KS16]SCQ21226.1 CAAX amino terminal protease self-immunity [Tannerella forsythia]SCQ23130.1 CAAX amino terminal protease self-immunity [Tannerella forsythia]
MIRLHLNDHPLVAAARESRFKPHPLLQIPLFIGIYIASLLPTILPYVLFLLLKDANVPGDSAMDTEKLIILFSCALSALVVVLYCRFAEGRSLFSMGFVRKDAWIHYLKGIAVGFVFFSTVYLTLIATGSVTFDGLNSKASLAMLLLFFFGFVIQGAQEEILTRGYFMMSLSTRLPAIAAILISSFTFSVLHLFNSGFGLLAFVNLVLYGVFLAVYMLKTGNIWGVCAIHSVWNFSQGNLYGMPVSGMNILETSLFSSSLVEGKEWLSGGAFGPEGGVITSAVSILAIVLTLLLGKRSSE